MMFKFFFEEMSKKNPGTRNIGRFWKRLPSKGLLAKKSDGAHDSASWKWGKYFVDQPAAIVCMLTLIGLTSCGTISPLPKVSLTDPGWSVRQGQAIWRPKRGGPELAGELLVATHANGAALVQFTKTPFPLVLAQKNGDSW